MLKQRGILAGLAVILVAIVVGVGVAGSTRQAAANHVVAADEMTITHSGFPSTPCVGGIAVPTCAVLDPGPAAGGTFLNVPVGSNFNVVVSVTSQGAPHNGYQAEIAFLDAVLNFVGTTVVPPGHLDSDLTSCAPAALLPAPPLEVWGQGLGCLAPGNAMFVNPVEEITLQCIAPATTLVALVDFASDPFGFGTTMIDLGGIIVPTITENQLPNPVPPPATVAAVVVNCLNPVDVSLTKSGPANAAVGAAGQYTITVNNPTLAPVNVEVDDAAPAGVTFTAVDNGPACSIVANAVQCNALAAPPGNTVITVDATFDTCGIKDNSATVALSPAQPVVDPDPANNTDNAVTDVPCPVLTKTPSATSAIVGSNVIFTLTATGYAPGTPVTIVDTLTAGQTFVSGVGCAAVLLTVTCGPTPADGAGQVSFVITVTMPLVPGQSCDSAVANPGPSNIVNVCITVNPAASGMVKDLSAADGFQNTGNLWICKGAGFPDPFAGEPEGDMPADQPFCNTISFSELLFLSQDTDTCNDDDDGDGEPCAGIENPAPVGPAETGAQCTGFNAILDDDSDGIVNDGCPNNASQDNCPLAPGTENYLPGTSTIDCDGGEVGEGLGAIEFQLKYDHKMFQQPEIECTGLLTETGRVVAQVVSVVTENWSLLGCVTKGDAATNPNPPSETGDECDNQTDDDGNLVVNDGCPTPGVLAPAGAVATVTLTIQPDLFQRLRPTKDNGVIVDLLDENCEAADIYGMPWNASNTTQGGLLEDCGDASITIRMLEGDMDLDCEVDLTDDQAVAYRYGAFFGNLLYHKFYDLEPNIAPDFDIDIKDLQTVFGRNGSTCANPIPDQDPGSMIPDP